ncbi:MAG: zinc-binding dehydrogenase, partial [Nitrososphaerales archaeon]
TSHMINARHENVEEAVQRLTLRRGVDAIIDFVSTPSSISSGFASLAPEGKLVLLGHFHPGDPLHIDDPQDVIRKEISILGSRYATKHEFREAIEMVERGLIEPVVTSVYKFEDADKALRDVEEGNVAGRAVIEFV